MVEHQADYGIALDGDGDRDHGGPRRHCFRRRPVDLHHRASSPEARQVFGGVVGTLMTNLGVEHALERQKIPFSRAAVGDRYVLEQLNEQGWQLGGESSGHILCLDKHTTGDGIVSALQVLEALSSARGWLSLADAAKEVTLYPQVLINVRIPKGFDYRESLPVQAALVELNAN